MRLVNKYYVFFLIPLLGMCGKKEEAADTTNASNAEPDHVVVQHILIGYDGAPRLNVSRSLEDAKTLAYDILERAKSGEDFEALSKEYSDDRPPGIYKLANNGVTPDQTNGEYARGVMAKRFSDVSFSLKISEFGIADQDSTESPFGWHIIKRLE
ncbi:peptidylprolyl isomerase [candidate division KSB1 bacterium]|nr:peptidylprolyl isomerase [candidate division KSB1 bacterium]